MNKIKLSNPRLHLVNGANLKLNYEVEIKKLAEGMHDGFKVVKRKRNRKQKLKSDFDTDNFNRKLEKALEEFQSSRFCFELNQSINTSLDLLDSETISEILCYGLGNLDNKSSIHQLAALITLQKKFNSTAAVHDPVFNSFDIKTLEDLGIEVIPDNEEGKRQISNNKTTLVFLPHCSKQLTNNFLWANWSLALSNCLLISNSFTKIIQDNTKKTLEDSADYILKIQSKTTEISFESYHIDNIFNDISLHYFTGINETFFIETLDKEPLYLIDDEIIKKVTE